VVQHGIEVDNGQHVLLGAYRQNACPLADVHRPWKPTDCFHRLPLTLATLWRAAGAADSSSPHGMSQAFPRRGWPAFGTRSVMA
jgi:hypothetical protein